MLGLVGEFAIGAAFIIVAVVLVFIGIPRHGESPRFLRFEASVVLFPPVIMTFFAIGAGPAMCLVTARFILCPLYPRKRTCAVH